MDETNTSEQLFETTDDDRRRNVRRALLREVESIKLAIKKNQEKLELLLDEADKAEKTLADFYALEPELVEAVSSDD